MSVKLVWRSLTVGFAMCVTTTSWAQQNFSNLIIFGDSLSDTGNVVGAITPNLPSPYFDNRISDGPLAVDVLAASLGKTAMAAAAGGSNYAVVGGNVLGSDLGDLTAQVNRYLGDVDGQADPNALYLILMGGNDLRDLRGQTSNAVADQILNQIIGELQSQLQRLLNSGVRNVMLANVADIGRIPQTLGLEQTNPGIGARTTAYVQSYNLKLAQLAASLLATPGLNIVEFDTFTELNKILDAPATFGFSITMVGCFDPNDSINPFDFDFDVGCDNPLFPIFQPNFDGYVFFDSIHPTAATHDLIGQAMIQSVNQAPRRSKFVPIAAITQLLLAD